MWDVQGPQSQGAAAGTWELVTKPSGVRALPGKWVFKLKLKADGTIERYKARWVVKGFKQQEGVDFNDTFASTPSLKSFRMLLALAAKYKLELKHFDVPSAFLNGQLSEDIYVQQPTGFNDGSGRVCRLRRSLYGLKQAPRIWQQKAANVLK